MSIFPDRAPDGLGALIAAGIIDHGDGQGCFQGGQDRRQELGGGHQVNVLRPLGDQAIKNGPQAGAVHGLSRRSAADGGILAVHAAQGAAAEKHGPAAAVPGQGRFFPLVEHGFRHDGLVRAAAEAKGGPPVHSAAPGDKDHRRRKS